MRFVDSLKPIVVFSILEMKKDTEGHQLDVDFLSNFIQNPDCIDYISENDSLANSGLQTIDFLSN